MADGVWTDRCPNDGCLEVDRQHKMGGKSPRGEVYHNWSIFHANPREGGCGATWSRTSKQGRAYDESHGVRSKHLTPEAVANREYSVPSAAYSANWALAFGQADDAVAAEQQGDAR